MRGTLHTRKEDTNRKNKKTTCQFWERTPQVSDPQNVHCTKSNIDKKRINNKKLKKNTKVFSQTISMHVKSFGSCIHTKII